MSNYRSTGDVLKGPNGEWTTGSGQVLLSVHDEGQCGDRPCVIHHPSEHQLRLMATYWRDDVRIMERICKHGVGHPDPDSPWPEDDPRWSHGCDGCCR